MRRPFLSPGRAAAGLLALAPALAAAPLEGQLRPLDPAPWSVLAGERTLSAGAGLGVHRGQRAALAGTEGSLLEVGTFRLAWRSGRIALEAAGTAVRRFEDGRRHDAPAEGVETAGPRREDAGDVRVATSVLLTPPDAAARAVVRFGTRLPTTDNAVGLDRDRTDFFALAGASLRRGGLLLAGEAGVGIFGTRNENHEQSDPLVYALLAEYAAGPLTPSLSLVGHADAFDDWTPRGNEDLAELRAGVRLGGRLWMEAQWVKGLAEFSPASGLLLSAGVLR